MLICSNMVKKAKELKTDKGRFSNRKKRRELIDERQGGNGIWPDLATLNPLKFEALVQQFQGEKDKGKSPPTLKQRRGVRRV